jgi:hypothetical protein
LRGISILAASFVLLAAACGDDSRPQEDAGDRAATTEPAAATIAPLETRSALHPPLRESLLRFVRQLAEDATPHERLTDVAEQQLPTNIKVWCWNEDSWTRIQEKLSEDLPPTEGFDFAGLADLVSFDIHLAPWVCETLTNLETAGDDPATADALLVLAHEIRHFSSTGSLERATECAALQHVAETAASLGVSDARAERLAQIAWLDVYPANPPEYKSAECRPGGLLDQDPATPEFP